jgi:glycosyltransferase involved in cell wall biosynthesis
MQRANNTPLVSVIMNCYNGEKYLQKAINSVYSQTYSNWEIVFWDNASIDDSAKIAQSYDSKVRYFHTKDNTLLGEARVEAVHKANGKYLAFLDCDDLWEADKLALQIEAINSKPNIGLVYSRSEVISSDNRLLGIIPKNINLHSGKIFCELTKENFIPFVSVLISKESYENVGGFPSHYKNSTDYNLFLRISYNCQVIAIDKVLCKYREHGGNLSHSQYVISAKESIDSVALFLPDQCAITGLKYQYTQLVVAYIKDNRIFKALYLSIKYKVLGMLLVRVFKKCL